MIIIIIILIINDDDYNDDDSKIDENRCKQKKHELIQVLVIYIVCIINCL